MMICTVHWKEYLRWREKYETAELASAAICPVYLIGKDTLAKRLVACYFQRVLKGEQAGDPATAVVSKELSREIQTLLTESRHHANIGIL